MAKPQYNLNFLKKINNTNSKINSNKSRILNQTKHHSILKLNKIEGRIILFTVDNRNCWTSWPERLALFQRDRLPSHEKIHMRWQRRKLQQQRRMLYNPWNNYKNMGLFHIKQKSKLSNRLIMPPLDSQQ